MQWISYPVSCQPLCSLPYHSTTPLRPFLSALPPGYPYWPLHVWVSPSKTACQVSLLSWGWRWWSGWQGTLLGVDNTKNMTSIWCRIPCCIADLLAWAHFIAGHLSRDLWFHLTHTKALSVHEGAAMCYGSWPYSQSHVHVSRCKLHMSYHPLFHCPAVAWPLLLISRTTQSVPLQLLWVPDILCHRWIAYLLPPPVPLWSLSQESPVYLKTVVSVTSHVLSFSVGASGCRTHCGERGRRIMGSRLQWPCKRGVFVVVVFARYTSSIPLWIALHCSIHYRFWWLASAQSSVTAPKNHWVKSCRSDDKTTRILWYIVYSMKLAAFFFLAHIYCCQPTDPH